MRVLILATTTGYQTRAFGEAAERLGVELVFATDRCHLIEDPWQDGAIAIRFYDEEASVAAILAAAANRPIDAILVVGDRPTVIAARVADALGLPWHPAAAAATACHKQRTRERLRDAGLPVPWFRAVPVESRIPNPDERIPNPESRFPLFPCVVKPVALSGSRGVMRADDPQELAAALERLRALVGSPDVRAERNKAHDTALVEQFIPGREYAVEALMHHSALHMLAIFDKPDPLDGPFFEETLYVTPSSAAEAAQRAIVDAIARAASAIGLRHGPVHAECRVTPDGVVYVLEVAARPIRPTSIARCVPRIVVSRSRSIRSSRCSPETKLRLTPLSLRAAVVREPSLLGGRRASAKTASKAFGAKLASVRQIVALEDVSCTNQLQSTAWLIPADTLRSRPRRRRTRA